MDEQEIKYKYVPFLRNEEDKDIDIAYKTSISLPTLLKLKANSKPSYNTLKRFYDAGYDIITTFENKE